MSRTLLHPGQWLRGRHGEIAVLEWVGEGSYARVYRGEGPHGPVAIKLPKSEVEGAAPRLRTEEEVLAQRLHPALPELLDTGTLPAPAAAPAEPFWIALQWIAGETLRRRLERGRGLPLVQAVPVLLRIADAVAALHAAGWTHGDLRPDNVLLETATHHAFLLDLGEARRVEEGSGQRSAVSGQRSVISRVVPRAPGATLTGPATAAGPSGAPDSDLRQLGELLAWALTGVDPTREPDRLSRAAGYHPDVVQLWHDSRTGCLPAAALRDRLQRLARHLGLGAGRR
jgi:serine/threonine protein kinase